MLAHVGIAVRNLTQAIATYRLLLGREPSHIEDVSDQQVRAAIFEPVDGDPSSSRIELLEPTSPQSPIQRFLERHGEGLHHISIYVDDIETKLAELSAAGFRLIDSSPRLGAEGCRIAFVHPASADGVLLELQEKPK
jgi:methylmalonyl-CoA epimerase